MVDCINQSQLENFLWADLGWFIFQLEVQICFWSLAAYWPPTSCTWAFPLFFLVFYGELTPSSKLAIVFSKLNKPPLSNKPPISIKPPCKWVWNKYAPGGLNRGFTEVWDFYPEIVRISFIEDPDMSYWMKTGCMFLAIVHAHMQNHS